MTKTNSTHKRFHVNSSCVRRDRSWSRLGKFEFHDDHRRLYECNFKPIFIGLKWQTNEQEEILRGQNKWLSFL